ncbi:hypothetical protein E2L06_04120 [Haloterrigena sp. H1]|uniref:hypothetical protein n=1 Tax=Haloterrigena sp. H1 TaxID=2552943 RepID=UPI00110F5D86|nr:hypothetical protein [Haloterrigena sp. H1]TMT85820.1 hypothetical protein E2L06_04120 [Haloterrigena sp. H1]
MSVVITISDDGHIEATHNSGCVLWSAHVDPESLPHDYPCDKQLATGVESFFDYLLPFVNEDEFESESS